MLWAVGFLSKVYSEMLQDKANDEHDPPRALLLFEAAYALAPRPVTLISAANMSLKLGQASTAAAEYTALLPAASEAHKAMLLQISIQLPSSPLPLPSLVLS